MITPIVPRVEIPAYSPPAGIPAFTEEEMPDFEPPTSLPNSSLATSSLPGISVDLLVNLIV